MNAPEDNPADDVQPTREEWEEYEGDRPHCGDPLDEPVRCWCGAEGPYEDLFDDDTLDETCGGLGVLYCYCGGDFCVCHHHGETECPGCEDCAQDEFDEDFDDLGGEG